MSKNDVPRRLRRFHRKSKPIVSVGERAEEISKEIFPQIEKISKKEIVKRTVKEVRKFKKQKNRLPTNKEYDKIAESIFKQLKKEYKTKSKAKKTKSSEKKSSKSLNPAEERRKERKKQRVLQEMKRKHLSLGEKEKKIKPSRHKRSRISNQLETGSEIAQSKIEGLSIKELLGSSPKKTTKKDEFSLGLKEFEDSAIKPLIEEEHLTKEVNSKNSCPNCQTKTSHIIFCPECGNAFCSNCAGTAKKENNKVKYSCPKCKRIVSLQS